MDDQTLQKNEQEDDNLPRVIVDDDTDSVKRDSECSGGSDEYHSSPENFTSLQEPISSRERKNSEIERVDFDVILANNPQEPESTLPPLTKGLEHDRGDYYQPEIDSSIYRADEYPKESTVPGEVYIFNFETFQTGHSNRDGTRLDVKAFIETLGFLKFNVPKERIYNDLTKEKLFATIKTAVTNLNSGKNAINCLIVLFMTHGLANNVIATKDSTVTVEEIVQRFSDCQALDRVPKWFTFLACKEPKCYCDPSDPTKSNKLVSDSTFKVRLPEDVILYYSTTENNKSARIKEEGSWVIQELCSVLNRYGRRDELFAILTRTNKGITNNFVGWSDGEYFRQCPVILSTLQKKFFLTLSKDRVAQLEILSRIENLNQQLEKRLQ